MSKQALLLRSETLPGVIPSDRTRSGNLQFQDFPIIGKLLQEALTYVILVHLLQALRDIFVQERVYFAGQLA